MHTQLRVKKPVFSQRLFIFLEHVMVQYIHTDIVAPSFSMIIFPASRLSILLVAWARNWETERRGGCKHRGNWIMPLVCGNELSFFSISFTIWFYLVINESSVWWQQAAGCLLQLRRLSNRTRFPLRTQADAANHIHTAYTHTQTQLIEIYIFPLQPVKSTYLVTHRNPGCNSK